MKTLPGLLHFKRLGASAVPISLLLLPKCPLCLMPLFAALGIVIAPSIGLLYIAGAILVLAWLSVVLFLSRQPFVRITALLLALLSGLAIAGQNRLLIGSAALAMMAIGMVVSRTCPRSGEKGETCMAPSEHLQHS